MASITASTKHRVAMPAVAKKVPMKAPAIGVPKTKKGASKKAPAARRGSVAPPLKPGALQSPAAVEELKNLDKESQRTRIRDYLRAALGETPLVDKSTPHAASTSRSRGAAAADVALAAKHMGIGFVLRECGVIDEIQRMLFPEGIEAVFARHQSPSSGGLKPSTSAVSLTSLDDATTATTTGSIGTDSKRGKSTPADAREGSLLIIRALCQELNRAVEPYVVGAFLAAALDECGSNSSSVREAAEDTATALVGLASPWAFPCLICPLLLQSLTSNEWRVKFNALERLAQCADAAPTQVCRLLPKLIPAVTDQVWDTKAQVTKAAGSTLLSICQTNQNPDIAPAIPDVVKAICKPAETTKAVETLCGTTFVVSVDASSLSILCPVLARALKEKLAIHKRQACIVISNMSRLVDTPEDVAPFGPLLVPELKKVATNVQFEEIRDEALKALNNLTKALGSAYSEEDDEKAREVEAERLRVEAEQKRIEEEKEAEKRREEELRIKEEEERRKFKEAMDAQRELDKLQAEEERRRKEDEAREKDKAKRSTKGASGKCQGCGLKKCKKTCLFYKG